MAGNRSDFFETLWENWTTKGGTGPCNNCPAHWSIRRDFPGDPETRSHSYGHRPFYGDGENDVDIAIFGHEPGKASIPDYTEEEPNHTQSTFHEVRRDDVTEIPNIAGVIRRARPLFELLNTEFNVYWSQVKKCNEINYGEIGIEPDGRNSVAEEMCAGVGEYQGYLRDELDALNPKYVVTLGKQPYELFSEVFEIETLAKNFSRGIASGHLQSGVKTLSVSDESFLYIPTAHPSWRLHEQTKEQLSISPNGDQSMTERYYEALAEDIISLDQTSREK